MNKLYLQFTEFFEKLEWKHHQYGDQSVIHTHFCGDHGRWVGVAIAREEDKAMAFISLFPSVVPVNKRAVCAELVTRTSPTRSSFSDLLRSDHARNLFPNSAMPSNRFAAGQICRPPIYLSHLPSLPAQMNTLSRLKINPQRKSAPLLIPRFSN
jgi:hypothetical protein